MGQLLGQRTNIDSELGRLAPTHLRNGTGGAGGETEPALPSPVDEDELKVKATTAQMPTNSELRSYLKTLIAQENGSLPTVDKINGNMAWYARAKSSTYPKNVYFNSLGRSGTRVLNDLKSRFPDLFTVANTSLKNESSGEQDSGSSGSSSSDNKQDDENKNSVLSTNNDSSGDSSSSSGSDSEARGNSSGSKITAGGQTVPTFWTKNIKPSLEKVDKKVWYGLGGGLALILLISTLNN